MHWLPTQERKYLPLQGSTYPDNLVIRLSQQQETTPSPATPGLIGPRLWTQAATAPHRSRATSAAAVDAAGLERLNMSRTPNTERKIYKYHEAWATANGYRIKRQAPSVKLQASSSKRLQLDRANLKPQAASLKLQAASYKLFDL